MDKSSRSGSSWLSAISGMVIGTVAATASPAAELPLTSVDSSRFQKLSDAEAWRRLPVASTGGGQPLPTWARILAKELPRTTAALLELDFAQRTRSPVEPGLRAAMHWVVAHSLHCDYAEQHAGNDAVRAGVNQAKN